MFKKTVKRIKTMNKVKRRAYLRGRKDQKSEDDEWSKAHFDSIQQTHTKNQSTLQKSNEITAVTYEEMVRTLKDSHARELQILKQEHRDELNKKQEGFDKKFQELKDDYNADKRKYKAHLDDKERARNEEHQRLKDDLVNARREAEKQALAWQDENNYLKGTFETFYTRMFKVVQHVDDISKAAARIVGSDQEVFNRLHEIIKENEIRVSQTGPSLNKNKRPDLP